MIPFKKCCQDCIRRNPAVIKTERTLIYCLPEYMKLKWELWKMWILNLGISLVKSHFKSLRVLTRTCMQNNGNEPDGRARCTAGWWGSRASVCVCRNILSLMFNTCGQRSNGHVIPLTACLLRWLRLGRPPRRAHGDFQPRVKAFGIQLNGCCLPGLIHPRVDPRISPGYCWEESSRWVGRGAGVIQLFKSSGAMGGGQESGWVRGGVTLWLSPCAVL